MFKIMGVLKYSAVLEERILGTAETKERAEELKTEYSLAYGREWHMWVKKTDV